MKRFLATMFVAATAAAAAAPVAAQPITPIESLFGALLGGPRERVYRPGTAVRDPFGRPAVVTRNGSFRDGVRRYNEYGYSNARTSRGFLFGPSGRSARAARAPANQSPDPRYARQVVGYGGGEAPGTIVIDTSDRFLYLVQENGTAVRYGVGVGRAGFEWSGRATIGRKAEWPDWHPPAAMRAREPWLPVKMEGGPENPLGARAMYLYKDGRDTLYRIHGTNQPQTIGQALSSGCIRMLNDDVADLYERVGHGTKVVVI